MNSTNAERNADYLEKFCKGTDDARAAVLKFLVKSRNPLIFDIGANEGQSIDYFKSLWPDSLIHSFEPQNSLETALSNVSNKYKNVSINMFALGERTQKNCKFYFHELDMNNPTGKSGFNKLNLKSRDSINIQLMSTDELLNYNSKINKPSFTDMLSGSDYISNKKIEKIDILKIDTQGYEDKVLEGFGGALKKVSIVICEVMFYDFYEKSLSISDIENLLIPYGFRLYDISHISKNPMNGRTDWADLIYINLDS